MSDRYPWAAEVLELLGAPPESVAKELEITYGDAWEVEHDGLQVTIRRFATMDRVSVSFELPGLWLVADGATGVPATVRALLVGLRATQAALGEVAS